MIVLDTNVITEFMRIRPDPGVIDWLRGLTVQPVTTAINRAEILAGISLLPTGRRRDDLMHRASTAFERLDPVLPMTSRCATGYAEIVARRRSSGRPIGAMDAMIAAIARDADLPVATRNLADFEGAGVELIDPWTGRPS